MVVRKWKDTYQNSKNTSTGLFETLAVQSYVSRKQIAQLRGTLNNDAWLPSRLQRDLHKPEVAIISKLYWIPLNQEKTIAIFGR